MLCLIIAFISYESCESLDLLEILKEQVSHFLAHELSLVYVHSHFNTLWEAAKHS